jgi:hypothetical protein
MKSTLAKPSPLPQFNIRAWLKQRVEKTERQGVNPIFSLASQRCAGFTTRPEIDY